MFEQFSAAEKHTNPWAVMLSFTTQAAVAGSVVLLSIIQFQKLDLSALVLQPPPLFAPSPIPEAVRIVAVERSGSVPRFTVTSTPRAFVAPTRIPDKVAYIDDGRQVPTISMADLLGSRQSGSSGPANGVPFAATQTATAPPPPPQQTAVAKTPERPPLKISSGVLEAMVIRKVTPVYPPLARQMRLSGVVRLVGVIGKEGTVQNLQVLEGHPLFVRSAVDAVRQWLYRPTLLNGDPVAVVAPIEVRFVLN
jgi:protein TonB